MRNNQFLQVSNSLLELEKDQKIIKSLIGLKDRELKDRKVKTLREIEELFYKFCLQMIWIDDMDCVYR